MGTPKVMKLVCEQTGMMECKVCGSLHQARMRPGGNFYRGSWQCRYGCQLPERNSGKKDERPTMVS